jgi:hypothetical protein
MAKTYVEVHREAKILILDYAASLGGTWARERLYPGLKTNNLVGSYEFSDHPLVPEKYGIAPGQHIPGQVVHAYLHDVCEAYGLGSVIRLRTRAESVTMLPSGEWQIDFTTITPVNTKTSTDDPSDRDTGMEIRGSLVTSKLVLATGLTSEPFMPPLPGKENFQGLVFHAKDFKTRYEELNNAKTVIVIGGNKSAWDVCYTCATRFNAKAHMVMRRSGGGPSWCWPARMKGSLSSISRISATRLYTWLDPNPYGISSSPIRAFFTRNWLGRKLSKMFWRHLDGKVSRHNAYDDGTSVGDLKPWTSTFWMGNSVSIHNYETSWFDLAREGQIKAHAAQIVSMSENTVHLSDGTTVEADAVICCTGWEVRPTLKFLPEGIASRIGLPSYGDHGKELELELAARTVVLRNAPVLKEEIVKQLPGNLVPENKEKAIKNSAVASVVAPTLSPYRLHRFVLPIDPEIIRLKNMAIIGAHMTVHTAILSQAQALWITALFDNKIPHLSEGSDEALSFEEIRQQTYYHTEYQRLRRPHETGGTGNRCPDLVFDSIPYTDLLLSDLKLRYHRKPSWYQELMKPYCLGDFDGLVQEWLQKTK